MTRDVNPQCRYGRAASCRTDCSGDVDQAVVYRGAESDKVLSRERVCRGHAAEALARALAAGTIAKVSIECGVCRGKTLVCENHPRIPWGGADCCCGPDCKVCGPAHADPTMGSAVPAVAKLCEHGACHCGAGMPCPACTEPHTAS